MSDSKEPKRSSNPPTTAPAGPPAPGAGTTPEDAESRKANRNFLLWWIGLPLLIMLALVLFRDRG